jgi:hypothetical protein
MPPDRPSPWFIRATAPMLAAGVTVEDVRRAFYEAPGVPQTQWITEILLDPPQLIVCDDAAGKLYRVPVQLSGDGVSFGAPVQVEQVFTDVTAQPGETAAARASRVVRAQPPRSPARPGQRGGTPGRVSDADERHIQAAIQAGRLHPSSAAHWRQKAAQGADLSVLDTLAAVPPDLLKAANGAPARSQDDAAYEALFGQPGQGDGPDDPVYAALFPTVAQDRKRADARLAAALKAAAALSDDGDAEYEALFGKGGSR